MSAALDRFYLVSDSQMPGENTMVGPVRADSLEECAQLCERHNAILEGSYAADGAMSTGYSWQHCNAFVYDRQRRLCTLKNKRMGNFYPQEGPANGACGGGGGNALGGNARYVSGYPWSDMVNEINSPFPNMASGMQYGCGGARSGINPGWSSDTWGVAGNHCTNGARGSCTSGPAYCPENVLAGRGVELKPVGWDVRPGAIVSAKNVTTGPYSTQPAQNVQRFRVANMQQCADLASERIQARDNPRGYTGANAWTFHPDYTTGVAVSAMADNTDWPGTCSLAHVREPYYQTLTPEDNGAISGFAVNSLSRANQRFLFGPME